MHWQFEPAMHDLCITIWSLEGGQDMHGWDERGHFFVFFLFFSFSFFWMRLQGLRDQGPGKGACFSILFAFRGLFMRLYGEMFTFCLQQDTQIRIKSGPFYFVMFLVSLFSNLVIIASFFSTRYISSMSIKCMPWMCKVIWDQ